MPKMATRFGYTCRATSGHQRTQFLLANMLSLVASIELHAFPHATDPSSIPVRPFREIHRRYFGAMVAYSRLWPRTPLRRSMSRLFLAKRYSGTVQPSGATSTGVLPATYF